jgi:hypothetical protein
MIGGRLVRGCLRTARDFKVFGQGYARYLMGARNDHESFLALRRLFCRTNGRLNDLLAYWHAASHPPYPVDVQDSVLAGLEAGLPRVIRDLDRDGYHVFGQLVPEELCGELTDLAVRAPCSVLDSDGKWSPEPRRFDPARPDGVRFELQAQDVMANPAAQKLVADPGLLAVAQAYFRAKAVQDLVAMWWSAPSDRPSSTGAQLFHFDLDRVKFLKFFLYLTDVDERNGPHCYIAGSHRRMPAALRRDTRHTDEEVFACYPPEKRVEIKGPRGTLAAVDTRGFHKGKQLVAGHRLLFQVEYAINLFGMSYPPIVLDESFSPQFLAAVRRFPYTFANYVEAPPSGR